MNPRPENRGCPPEIHPFTTRWQTYNQGHITPDAEAAWVVNQEKGYFGFLPNRQIKHLIIGSFPIWESVHNDPPHGRFNFAFFYCSGKNGFFKFMKVLSGYDFFNNPPRNTPYQQVQSIADFFLEKELGITDVIWKVERTDVNCRSASDAKLNPRTLNNLCQLLADYPEITNIYFTSRKVADWYGESMQECIHDLGVDTSILYSPSPASNLAAAGTLNNDEEQYGEQDSMRFHSSQIPFLEHETRTDRYKIAKWAKRLRNVSGLVRPEILENAHFMAIEDRL